MMKKLLVVVGTRPNFIKVTRMRSVAAARGDWEVKLVHTGQHFDDRMSTVFFEQFGLVPDHWLGIHPGTPNTYYKQGRPIELSPRNVLKRVLALYAERGWGNDMTVGVGCKGGRHRSVVGAEFLAAGLREHGHTVTVFHRDLSREGNA